jgi:hypothetical protein
MFIQAVVVSLDCRSWKELWRFVLTQFISLTLGFTSIFFCQLSDLHISNDQSHRPQCKFSLERHMGDFPNSLNGTSIPFRLNMLVSLVSVCLFLDLYCLLFRRVQEWRHTPLSSSSSQALFLTVWITVAWSAAPVIYYLGSLELPWFGPTVEQVEVMPVNV